MVTFQFPAGKIRAALIFAGVNDVRYYLNGVLFTRAPNGKGVLAVSTDGHRLAAVYHEQDISQLPADFAVIVPREELATAAKNPLKAGHGVVLDMVFQFERITSTDSTGVEHVSPVTVAIQSAVKVECQAIDGKFPDYQRIIPRADSTVPTFAGPDDCYGINPAYLGDYAKAFKALDGRGFPCIRIKQNGGSAMLVQISGMPDFLSVLMPARESAPELPDWMDAPAAEVPEAPAEEQAARVEAGGEPFVEEEERLAA